MFKLLFALWPSSLEAAVTFYFLPKRASYHVPLRDLSKLDDEDVSFLRKENETQHVYFGLGARMLGLSEGRQGGKNEVIWLPGFALDVDFLDPIAHKAQNLPRDLDEAMAIWEGSPDPSAVVHTGNGAHLYWFFDVPLALPDQTRRKQAQEAYAVFERPFRARAEARGWHLDATSTIQRVWRVPGFENRKTGREVELLYCDETVRYSVSDLGISLPKPRKDREPPKTVEPGAGRGVLKTIRERLACITEHDNVAYENIRRLLCGESFADPGERENTVQRLASTIAWMPEGRDADPATLAEMFRPSFVLWAAEEGAKLSVDEEMRRAADKIRRSQRDYYDKKEQTREQYEGLAQFARRSKSDEPLSVDELQRCAIVVIAPSYYVFDFVNGRYARALRREEISSFVRFKWANAPEGISNVYVNEKSEVKAKNDTRLVQEYGVHADHVVGDLALETSHFDFDSEIFYEAVTKRRDLESKRSPEIEEWLKILCGESYPLVADWLAGLPMLSHQHCGLYLEGPKEVGKSLLAQGLGRIWRTGGPTPLESVLSNNFNAEIVACPLLWVDEGFSKRAHSAAVRRIIGETSFHLHQKFQTPRLVRGCPRILITANNPDVLNFSGETLRVDDMDAIASRFLHVKVHAAGGEWLRARNAGRRMTERWVDGDEMARHCLYLAETRTLDLSKRFLVEGSETALHRNLLMQSEEDNLVFEWVVRFATNPKRILDTYRAAKKLPRVLIGMGEILINAQGVVDHWEEFMKVQHSPSAKRIGMALAKIARKRFQLQWNGERVWFRALGLDFISQWCNDQGIGDELKIRTNLDLDLDFLVGVEVEEDAA